MKDRDFQRLKGSVQEMVDAELDSPNSLQDKMSELEGRGFQRVNDPRSNTLTEQDAERLEKVGFSTVVGQQGETIIRAPVRGWWVVAPESDVGKAHLIDDALIGVLVGMAHQRRIDIFRTIAPNLTIHTTRRANGVRITIGQGATPRQIFDTLIQTLEATDEGE